MKGYFADGQVFPARFLTTEGVSADYQIKICESGEMPIAISDSYGRDAPIPSITADPQQHAADEEPVAIIRPGGSIEDGTALLQLGGTVTRGQRLMPNTNSDGTALVATAGNWVGAVADESGTIGQWIRVTPISPVVEPA